MVITMLNIIKSLFSYFVENVFINIKKIFTFRFGETRRLDIAKHVAANSEVID